MQSSHLQSWLLGSLAFQSLKMQSSYIQSCTNSTEPGAPEVEGAELKSEQLFSGEPCVLVCEDAEITSPELYPLETCVPVLEHAELSTPEMHSIVPCCPELEDAELTYPELYARALRSRAGTCRAKISTVAFCRVLRYTS